MIQVLFGRGRKIRWNYVLFSRGSNTPKKKKEQMVEKEHISQCENL